MQNVFYFRPSLGASDPEIIVANYVIYRQLAVNMGDRKSVV